ncbi:MAG: hypothetical protein DI630_05930, partial [Gordonia sp. (in: high G+C Gram-positive bacteria)]
QSAAVVIPTRKNSHASGITVALEAAATGRPIVCSYDPNIFEYFPEDRLYVFEPGNSRDLARAINECLTDDFARQSAKINFLLQEVERRALNLPGYWYRVTQQFDAFDSVSKPLPL